MKQLDAPNASGIRLANVDVDTARRNVQGDYGQGMAQSIGNMTNHLEQTALQYARVKDSGDIYDMENQLIGMQNDFDLEIMQSSNISPGFRGSLFTIDGQIDKARLDELTNKYIQKANEINKSTLLPDSQIKINEGKARFGRSLTHKAMSSLIKMQTAKSKESFEERGRLALVNGDYREYERIMQDGVLNGIITDTKAQINIGIARQQERGIYVDMMAYKDPAKLVDELADRNSQLNANATQDELNNYWRKASAGMAKLQSDKASNARYNEKAKGSLVQAPMGINKGLYVSWNKYNGDFKNNPDAQSEVVPHLLQYANAVLTDPNDIVQQEQIKTMFNAFGKDDTFANQAITAIQKRMTDNQSLRLDEHLNLSAKAGYLTETHDKLSKTDIDRKAFIDNAMKGKLSDKEKEAYKKELLYLDNRIKAMDIRRDYFIAENKEMVRSRYDEWLITEIQKGNNPSKIEQYNKLYDIISNVDAEPTDYKNNRMFIQGQREILNNTNAFNINNSLLNKDALDGVYGRDSIRKTDASRLSVTSPLKDEYAILSYSNLQSDNGEKCAIYVPKGSPLAKGRTGTMIAKDNNCFSNVEIIESDEVDKPTMSKALNRQMNNVTGDDIESVISITGVNVDLNKYAPDLSNNLNDFYEAGSVYGIDPVLLMAISRFETNNGKSKAYKEKNNAMGVSSSSGVVSFNSTRESILYMAKRLKENYIDKGLDTIGKIGAKYAPVGASNDINGTNNQWAIGVSKFYNEMKS